MMRLKVEYTYVSYCYGGNVIEDQEESFFNTYREYEYWKLNKQHDGRWNRYTITAETWIKG